jgi:cell division protein FtsZ
VDRRHFLHTINAFGIGTVLPASPETPQATPRFIESTNSGLLNAVVRNALRVGVVGIGGAGGNVLNYLADGLPHLDRTVAINTHVDSLRRRKADRKIRIDDIDDEPVKSNMARRAIVRRNARSAADEIAEAVAGLDMVLLVAGMGGMAGTVISPIVAQVLREQNIFTVGVPILPFEWEGKTRNQTARSGARELGQWAHSLLLISNDAMARDAGENATMDEVFCRTNMNIRQLCLDATSTDEIGRHARADLCA